ncbi:hypothetical protein DAEQUDRAFT_712462 [Daedalea quercina L-15889]|uniref:FAD-binding domain-containing protein n=1 Tax=Daedalea quercina L-15889 TaxID=1314783 RepID=A0A165PCK8_9APHY|nr:hypothetical protein DAEQUDRAFT_712462 [Daedalea quercina L-15889]
MATLRPTLKKSVDTDVLIIGAGPAGLMAALTMSVLGIGVKLIDRRIPGETAGRGDGIGPRMLEIWDSLGIGAELRAIGAYIHRVVLYAPNGEGSGIKEAGQGALIPIGGTPYPHMLGATSSVIEGILIRALTARGIIVEHPFVPESLQIVKTDNDTNEPYVEVGVAELHAHYLQEKGIRQADRGELVNTPEAVKGKRAIRAKYILACDGARSWVRKAVNIALEGETTDLVWGVIDFTPETDFPTTRANCAIAPPLSGGVLYVVREDDTARVYTRLQTDPNALAENETQKSTTKDSQEKIMQVIEKAFLPYTMRFTKITWCNAYKVGQRVASTFSSDNRVFLLGDAGRTHSPMAGQGANAAMTDAYNLGKPWKLAYVLKGRADANILDTYEAERRAHALELIQIDRNIFKAFSADRLVVEAYANVLGENNMFLSGIGIKCNSRLTVPDEDNIAPGLRLGERVPWAHITRHSDWNPVSLLDLMPYNGHFKLIILPGDTRDPAVAQRFNAFAGELVQSVRADVLEYLDMLTVLNTPKEAPCESLELPPAFRAIDNVYVDEAGQGQARRNGGLYEDLQIRPGTGAVIIVRPDAMTAVVTGARAEHVSKIVKYFDTL